MPYGQSCHPMQRQGQKETFSMYWMAELYSIESRGLEGRQPIRISVDYTVAMWPRSTGTLSSCLMATTTCLQRTWHTKGEQQRKPEQLSPSQRTCKSHWKRIISSLTLRTSKQFINMLSRFLHWEDNCPTYHAEGDADVLIVKTAVESAKERNTVLVGADTDLLVLLCFYTRSDIFDLYFKPEPKASSRRRVWNMKRVKDQLGDDLCHDLLFLHSI